MPSCNVILGNNNHFSISSNSSLYPDTLQLPSHSTRTFNSTNNSMNSKWNIFLWKIYKIWITLEDRKSDYIQHKNQIWFPEILKKKYKSHVVTTFWCTKYPFYLLLLGITPLSPKSTAANFASFSPYVCQIRRIYFRYLVQCAKYSIY